MSLNLHFSSTLDLYLLWEVFTRNPTTSTLTRRFANCHQFPLVVLSQYSVWTFYGDHSVSCTFQHYYQGHLTFKPPTSPSYVAYAMEMIYCTFFLTIFNFVGCDQCSIFGPETTILCWNLTKW